MARKPRSVSPQVLLAWVVLAAVSITPSTILATKSTKFMVGDSRGWDQGVDYVTWAKGKTFHVGDKLVFLYSETVHNVFKVTKHQYQNCTIPSSAKHALTSGYDIVKLTSPGKKWYICGMADHCATGGQKLAINVKPSKHHH
ncbi:unnamed protein product [Linum tenue]|uniref:Phytocyanin domain-containing protein n=1 Tax=Linum tenue TaxID=586396 RepID=A0AAV0LEE5_9ROSI|nr:unnamed protein product [Linum tenue]